MIWNSPVKLMQHFPTNNLQIIQTIQAKQINNAQLISNNPHPGLLVVGILYIISGYCSKDTSFVSSQEAGKSPLHSNTGTRCYKLGPFRLMNGCSMTVSGQEEPSPQATRRQHSKGRGRDALATWLRKVSGQDAGRNSTWGWNSPGVLNDVKELPGRGSRTSAVRPSSSSSQAPSP